MITVLIKKLTDDAKLPKKMTNQSAGWDLFSNNDEKIIIKPGNLEMIPTGVSIALPSGYEAQIRPRSGLAFKYKIGILNSPGTVDSDYRGELKILLYNFSKEEFLVEKHMRIAQLVIAAYEKPEFILKEKLPSTKRNERGFGHTKI